MDRRTNRILLQILTKKHFHSRISSKTWTAPKMKLPTSPCIQNLKKKTRKCKICKRKCNNVQIFSTMSVPVLLFEALNPLKIKTKSVWCPKPMLGPPAGQLCVGSARNGRGNTKVTDS